ncbi:MalY/PatB family protein [Leekyejoonella antrihumi]|nr:aminotransferase class I/II-fold pyridoxal phosphate-dependent enzyme [Leekyejoonella antrihumi]
MTIAEMDVALAEPVAAALADAIRRSDTGYFGGSQGLGEAFAEFSRDRWGWVVDPNRLKAVTDVGVGAVELLRRLGANRKKVAFSPPVYPPFFDWVREAGGTLAEVPLARDGASWRLDLDALDAAFAGGIAAYILCNPHNPVGRVHRRQELERLVQSARRHGVAIVSDEIHAPLALDPDGFTPLLALDAAADVGYALVSASKGWNLAGLKCAAVVTASSQTAAVVDGFPPDTQWRVGQLGVIGSVAAYRSGAGWLDALIVELRRKRDLLADLIDTELPGVVWDRPEAGYLAWLDCSGVFPQLDARDEFLRAGVALEPGARFGGSAGEFVRLNFATSDDVLEEAVARMSRAVGQRRA